MRFRSNRTHPRSGRCAGMICVSGLYDVEYCFSLKLLYAVAFRFPLLEQTGHGQSIKKDLRPKAHFCISFFFFTFGTSNTSQRWLWHVCSSLLCWGWQLWIHSRTAAAQIRATVCHGKKWSEHIKVSSETSQLRQQCSLLHCGSSTCCKRSSLQ